MFKVEIKIGSGGSYVDYTDDLMNWQEVDLSYKRSELTGITRAFSSSFQLCGDAFTELLNNYLSNGIDGVASLKYSLMQNDFTYVQLFECALDYSTFQYNHTSCSINAIDNSLASILKAKGNTKYQFNVADLKHAGTLNYDHLPMNSFANYLFGGSLSIDGTYTTIDLPHTSGKSSLLYLKESEIADKGMMTWGEGNDFIFFNNSDDVINVRFHFSLSGTTTSSDDDIQFVIATKDATENWIYAYPLWSADLYPTYGVSGTFTIPIVSGTGVYVYLYNSAVQNDYTMTINATSFFEMSCETRSTADALDVITPSSLCNALLQTMTGDNALTATMPSGDTRFDNTIILAAESARKITGAQIYTSWNDFCDFMSSQFGFVPSITDAGAISFVHRDTLFSGTLAKALTDIRDVQLSVQSDLIYSKIKVGYEKVDYDSANGRDEWRFGVDYNTGHTLTDNELEMICPYRADAYGIEFLTQMIGEDTTDDSSDEDIFIVNASYSSSWTLIRSITLANVISTSYMFNAAYSQRYMIAANEHYLASFGLNLDFASCEGNDEVVVDGTAVTADVTLTSPIILPAVLQLTTSEIDIPSNLAGYISLTDANRTYTGYIKDAAYHVGQSKAVTYNLYVHTIS